MDAWEIFEGDKLRGKIYEHVVISPFGARHFIPYMLKKFESEEVELRYFDQRIWNGKKPRFTFIYSQVGPTNADLTVMLLKGTGVREVILVGSCGGLRENMNPGDIVIPQAFYGFDYVSELWSKEKPYYVDENLRKALLSIAEEKGISYHSGTSATVDSLHRQVRLDLSNFVCAEMEGSVFAAAARKLGYRFAAVLWVSDVPARGEKMRDPLSKANKQGMDRAWEIILTYLNEVAQA